jgi:hypothetical protein
LPINPLSRTSHQIAGSTGVRRRCCAPRSSRASVRERRGVAHFGAEAPRVSAAITPVADPETMELLANAADTEAIMADVEERAAEGDQSAKDCLAAKTGAAA